MELQLGFILKNTDGGETEAHAINKNELWSRYVDDPRSYIKKLNNFDETENVVLLLRFLGEHGYLISIIKARPLNSGRPYDNTAAWIYIPANINIDGKQIEIIINGVKKEISASKRIDYSVLNNLFSASYQAKNVQINAIASIKSNDEKGLGICYYGRGTDYNLDEFFGIQVAQTVYSDYSRVFLVEKECRITLANNQEISSDYYKDVSTINPPKDDGGFKAYICDPLTKFSLPIEVKKGDVIKIIWKKDNYSSISKEFTVPPECISECPDNIKIKSNERKIIVPSSRIGIYNNRNEIIKDCSITVNDKVFGNIGIEITEEEYNKNVNLEVSCKGYSTKKSNCKLDEPVKITLEKITAIKEYTLPINQGRNLNEDAKIIIERIDGSNKVPLKGYYSKGGDYLYYNSDDGRLKIRFFILGFVSFFLLLIASLAFLYLMSPNSSILNWLTGKQESTEINHKHEVHNNRNSSVLLQKADTIDNSPNKSLLNDTTKVNLKVENADMEPSQAVKEESQDTIKSNKTKK